MKVLTTFLVSLVFFFFFFPDVDTEDNNTNVCDSLKLLLDNSCCDAHNPTINTLWVRQQIPIFSGLIHAKGWTLTVTYV